MQTFRERRAVTENFCFSRRVTSGPAWRTGFSLRDRAGLERLRRNASFAREPRDESCPSVKLSREIKLSRESPGAARATERHGAPWELRALVAEHLGLLLGGRQACVARRDSRVGFEQRASRAKTIGCCRAEREQGVRRRCKVRALEAELGHGARKRWPEPEQRGLHVEFLQRARQYKRVLEYLSRYGIR